MKALQLLGVGSWLETVFLVLVILFGFVILFITTIQSIQDAVSPASSEPRRVLVVAARGCAAGLLVARDVGGPSPGCRPHRRLNDPY